MEPAFAARTATVGALAAMEIVSSEAAATVEASVVMEIASAVVIASFAATTFIAAAEPASIAKALAAEATVKAPPIIVVATAIKSGAAIIAAEPRTGADKDSAREVTGPVVPVRRAGVRISCVVAVLAYRGWSCVSRANSNADHDSLRMCVRRCDQANAKSAK